MVATERAGEPVVKWGCGHDEAQFASPWALTGRRDTARGFIQIVIRSDGPRARRDDDLTFEALEERMKAGARFKSTILADE